MSLLAFTQWLQSTDLATAFRGSFYVYPAVLSLHMVGLAMFGGMVLMVDVRLLGIAMKHRSVTDVVRQFSVLKRVGFALIVACGLMLFSSKAEEYYYNVFFRVKITLIALVILHSIVFHRSVYGNPEALDRAPRIPGHAKLAAALSLILWTSLVICGRGIGYIEPPLDKIHARTTTPAVALEYRR